MPCWSRTGFGCLTRSAHFRWTAVQINNIYLIESQIHQGGGFPWHLGSRNHDEYVFGLSANSNQSMHWAIKSECSTIHAIFHPDNTGEGLTTWGLRSDFDFEHKLHTYYFCELRQIIKFPLASVSSSAKWCNNTYSTGLLGRWWSIMQVKCSVWCKDWLTVTHHAIFTL